MAGWVSESQDRVSGFNKSITVRLASLFFNFKTQTHAHAQHHQNILIKTKKNNETWAHSICFFFITLLKIGEEVAPALISGLYKCIRLISLFHFFFFSWWFPLPPPTHTKLTQFLGLLSSPTTYIYIIYTVYITQTTPLLKTVLFNLKKNRRVSFCLFNCYFAIVMEWIIKRLRFNS